MISKSKIEIVKYLSNKKHGASWNCERSGEK